MQPPEMNRSAIREDGRRQQVILGCRGKTGKEHEV